MLARREQTAELIDRPFNNLLRRLNPADYASLAPHLTGDEAKPGELLYNPGDNVQTVHFPCGPTLVSYMVPNEDGRDVETILIGREGAVGGIVSHGFLPAFTRITVKFGGPIVRLSVIKLEAANMSARISQHSKSNLGFHLIIRVIRVREFLIVSFFERISEFQ